jgi:hypothetical protein
MGVICVKKKTGERRFSFPHCAILSGRKPTQVRTAAILGIDQPKDSALICGKLDGFSSDRLFRFLNALGQDVVIVVRPRRQERHGSTRVVS